MPQSSKTRSRYSRSNKTRSSGGPLLSTTISGSIITTCARESTSLPAPPSLLSPYRDGQTILPPCGLKSCSSSCWLSSESSLNDASPPNFSRPSFEPPLSSSPKSTKSNIWQRRGNCLSSLTLPFFLPPLMPQSMKTPLSSPTLPRQWSPLRHRVPAPYPLQFADASYLTPMTSHDLDGWFHLSFLRQLMDLTALPVLPPWEPTLPSMEPLPPLLPPLPGEHAIQEYSITGIVSSVVPTATLNRTAPSGSVPSATSLPQDTYPWLALPDLPLSQDVTSPPTAVAQLMLTSEVAPQMYNKGYGYRNPLCRQEQ